MAVLLLLVVLGLLLRGVQAVTETVTSGTRKSTQLRQLQTLRRVLREDVEHLRLRPRWPVWVGDPEAQAPALALAFLRDRVDAGAVTDTEWVQIWREAHGEEDRLEVLVRYTAPADDRASRPGAWWEGMDPSGMDREVLADELIRAEWRVWNGSSVVSGVESNRVDMIELELAVTSSPVPVVLNPSASLLARLREEGGSDLRFRARPRVGPLPEVTR